MNKKLQKRRKYISKINFDDINDSVFCGKDFVFIYSDLRRRWEMWRNLLLDHLWFQGKKRLKSLSFDSAKLLKEQQTKCNFPSCPLKKLKQYPSSMGKMANWKNILHRKNIISLVQILSLQIFFRIMFAFQFLSACFT